MWRVVWLQLCPGSECARAYVLHDTFRLLPHCSGQGHRLELPSAAAMPSRFKGSDLPTRDGARGLRERGTYYNITHAAHARILHAPT